MTQETPTLAARLVYRLLRLRRMLALAALLVIAALAAANLVGGPESVLGDPGTLVLAFLAAMIPLTLLAVRYPRAASETLAAILATLPVVLVLPGFELLATLRPDISGGFAIVSFAGLALILWCAAFIASLQVLQTLGQRLPRRMSLISHEFHLPVPPEDAFRKLALLPDQQTRRGHTGPADPLGFFDVHQTRMAALPPSFHLAPVELIFSAQVLETGAAHQVVRLMAKDGQSGVETESRLTLICTPDGAGTWVQASEHHNHLNALGILLIWLADLQADRYQVALDDLRQRPSPALDLLPDDSLMAALARFAQGLNAPPGPR